MTQEIVALLAQYGLLLVFLNVLIEQFGVPVPAVPTLVLAGASAANGHLPLAGVIAVAVAACLISDSSWYLIGRRLGTRVMRTLCKVALTPDSCVKQSELRFQRWRGRILLIAKFVPGLATLAAPLVGALGLRALPFLLLDLTGSLLWAGLACTLGFAFAPQIDLLLHALEQAGTLTLEVIGLLLALYVGAKWIQRRRMLAQLRMARISAQELYEAMASSQPPVVIDIRTALARQHDDRMIPGALASELNDVDKLVRELKLPLEQSLVLYCMCPNEVSAVAAARRLHALGYRHIRPLAGGLDAWGDAGYAFVHMPPDKGDDAALSLASPLKL